MRKTNNVYGVIGIRSIDSKWNADFDQMPKTLPDGTIFGSDKALKYAIRKYWQLQGEPVLYVKTKKVRTQKNKSEIAYNTLEERYSNLFNQELQKSDDDMTILKNILSAIDARQFGFTFAVSGHNMNGTGPVQIGIGRNIFDESQINYQTILSPFVNGKSSDDSKASDDDNGEEKKKDKNTTLGELILSDRVNYCYPFYINPKQLDYQDIEDGLGEYTEEDYEKFVKAAAVCANAMSSCTKAGCQNEYLITVEAKDDSLYLNNLASYIKLEEDELKLDDLMNYLKPFMNRIKSVDIWFDKTVITVDDYEGIEKHKLSDLQ